MNTRHKGFQKGLIFNHFQELIFFSTKLFKSDADMMLKMSRMIKEDESITSDQQIFREIRSEQMDVNKLIYHFKELGINLDFTEDFTDLVTEDPKNIGGWFLLKSIIRGAMLSCHNTKQSKFFEFINALCEVDKQFIKTGRERQSKTQEENYHFLNELTAYWLPTVNMDFSNRTKEAEASYLISMVLHWAALYEKFLVTEFGEPDGEAGYKSIVSQCLPSLNKKSQLERSNSNLIKLIKSKWATHKYKTNSISWTTFYTDIANAIQEQEAKSEDRILEKQEYVNPEISHIKKRVSRWRKGIKATTKNDPAIYLPSFMSPSDLKHNFGILRAPELVNSKCLSDFTFIIIQLFEKMQFEVLQMGVSDEFIVNEFKNYNTYQKLVNKRFDNYCETGELTA